MDFITLTKKILTENFMFVYSGVNNTFILVYF